MTRDDESNVCKCKLMPFHPLSNKNLTLTDFNQDLKQINHSSNDNNDMTQYFE